jgi:hypothetical protein
MNPNRFCFARRPIRCSIYPLVCREEKKRAQAFFLCTQKKNIRDKKVSTHADNTHTRGHTILMAKINFLVFNPFLYPKRMKKRKNKMGA